MSAATPSRMTRFNLLPFRASSVRLRPFRRSWLFLLSFSVFGLHLLSGSVWATLNPPQPYSWKNVRIGGGGFVTGLLYHPTEPGLFYARTDVGGAYRWDNDKETWTPLTDFFGSDEVNLTGIESLAVDPADSNRLYLAAGTYTNPSSSNGAMLLSTDRGKTFKRVDLPFKLGANEAGRGDGERLVVDPHRSALLFFGSRAAGLWRSTDYGETWKEVRSFPARATSEAAATSGRWKQPVGIVFVLFDQHQGMPNEPTPEIFAGISSSGEGLYRSHDAGTTWESLPGQPANLHPQRAVLAPDRWLYLTFGDGAAPNPLLTGAVWRFQVDDGRWEDVTPLKPTAEEPFGYGGIATDPSHPGTLLVATFARWRPGDEIFRTQDGGKTWKPVLATSTWDHTSAPWTREAHPHWMADLKIDPNESNRAWFTTGYGVWETRNLSAIDQAQPVAWRFSDGGLEETVPLGLISPPAGPHLFSAVGDLDGYRHDDLNTSPLQFAGPPRFSNGEDLTFAAAKPEVIARTGTIRNRSGQVAAAYSIDAGQSWKSFATPPVANASAGRISVSSDGTTFIWTPRGQHAARTIDFGEHWQLCEGLPTSLPVIADSAKASSFYALEDKEGKLWQSEDGGVKFEVVSSDLPRLPPAPGGGGWRAGGTLRVAPEHTQDLWIGYRENGLFHSIDGGKKFAAIPGVQKVYSFGFGQAAPHQTYPTLFLAGRVENVNGLFRSDDLAQSWTRINDDQHQFGWISHVTGDPRIYGRVYFGTGGRGILYGDTPK